MMVIPTAVRVPFTVLIDQRERLPYGFTGLLANKRDYGDQSDVNRPLIVPTETVHLETGDYTIKGFEDLITVERKTLGDLYSTFGQGRERFEREHERMSRMSFACVVIEATLPTILLYPPDASQLDPKIVFRTMASWVQRYGVHWITVGPRRLAEITTFRILEMFWKHQNDPKKK